MGRVLDGGQAEQLHHLEHARNHLKQLSKNLWSVRLTLDQVPIPLLGGYAEAPAMHWLTTRKAKKVLHRAAFRQVYDQWDLAKRANLRGLKGWAARIICTGAITKTLASICTPSCRYAAVK